MKGMKSESEYYHSYLNGKTSREHWFKFVMKTLIWNCYIFNLRFFRAVPFRQVVGVALHQLSYIFFPHRAYKCCILVWIYKIIETYRKSIDCSPENRTASCCWSCSCRLQRNNTLIFCVSLWLLWSHRQSYQTMGHLITNAFTQYLSRLYKNGSLSEFARSSSEDMIKAL